MTQSRQPGLFDLPEDAVREAGDRDFHIDWPVHDRFRPRVPGARAATVGLLQYGPQDRTPAENVDFIARRLAGVRDAIIVLPEFFLGSYTAYETSILERAPLAERLRPLQSLTAERNISLVGSLPVRKGGGAANNVAMVDRGTTRFSVQDKGRLFGKEEADFTPGAQPRRTTMGSLDVSVQICMDIVDPLPAREAVGQGARAILGPSAVSVDFLRTIHKARALENQVVSVFCNRIGTEADGIRYLGRSALFLPDGAELAAGQATEELLTATVDLTYVPGYREWLAGRG
jgi:predicted amidohydrolase